MGACAEPLKILLVDDHKHVLWGLGKLLEGEWPRMMVVGTAQTMSEAVAAVHRHVPDVVVLDIVLGAETSIERIPDLIVNGGPQVLILTGRRDPELHRRALAAGARAIVLKDEPAEMLLREIERAAQAVHQAS